MKRNYCERLKPGLCKTKIFIPWYANGQSYNKHDTENSNCDNKIALFLFPNG